jgi:siroheme synthase (precorrin-2 oxidase/ferrochelatase)
LRSQCTLSWEVGKELGEELARRKWRWKLMQTWSRKKLEEEEDEDEEEDS